MRVRPRAARAAGVGAAWYRLGRFRVRRWKANLSLAGAVALAWTIGWNLFGVQDQMCSVRFLQPHLSDRCGDLGLGNKPTGAERQAWEALPAGDCEALKGYQARFPSSPLVPRAADALALRRPVREPAARAFVREPDAAFSYVRQAERPMARAAAEAAVRGLAERDAAENQCAPVDAAERLVRVELAELRPDCRELPGLGHFCGANYRARCHMHGRPLRDWCEFKDPAGQP
jgi:hypothetical protein